MSLKLFIWCLVATIFVIIFIVQCLKAYLPLRHKYHRRHIVEVGQEWEELYIPGDRIIRDKNDSDDFGDL